MKNLSLGKLRGLMQIADHHGFFTICAMDHRESLRSMLQEKDPDVVSYEEMVEHKLELCRFLSPHVSAVLLDPNFGAAQAIAGGALPGSKGLLVSIEATGYRGNTDNRLNTLQKDWSVAKIKRMGASAVKMLVYFRPDLKKTAQKQLVTIASVAKDCRDSDIAFLVEPKSYRLSGESAAEYGAKKPALVIETARLITALPVDVLKAEFPADLDFEKNEAALGRFCAELDSASAAPWVILSAGVDFEIFEKEVEIASRSGASGYLAGRAIWQEALALENKGERLEYLKTTVAGRITRLNDLTSRLARPWYQKINLKENQLTDTSENWYRDYHAD